MQLLQICQQQYSVRLWQIATKGRKVSQENIHQNIKKSESDM